MSRRLPYNVVLMEQLKILKSNLKAVNSKRNAAFIDEMMKINMEAVEVLQRTVIDMEYFVKKWKRL